MSRDTREFTQLLAPHYNDALRYSGALCANWSPDDAEDVLQQSFLQALENFESLNDVSKFKSWFFKIITRVFYSSIRKHFWKKFLPIENESSIIEMPSVFGNPDTNDDRLVLYSALSKLNSKERAAILLFEIAGFSIDEITVIQGEKSLSAVKSRLSRTRKKLRKYLEHPEPADQTGANGIFLGDIENETIRLVSELRNEK